ncbi:hypothetical protein M2478_001495 [Breznakia sp. PFB2-8]|nr:hypothetical protein [Breznakia sp. PFB2-8]MDF9860214.1 hypothetical protein [Breznakia sp. PH5-24]
MKLVNPLKRKVSKKNMPKSKAACPFWSQSPMFPLIPHK